MPLYIEYGYGIMTSPAILTGIHRLMAVQAWAGDNGCFTNPKKFSLDAYQRWMMRMLPAQRNCLFMTAPDVVGDALETRKRAAMTLPIIRRIGFPAAFVAQNGMENISTDWNAFDVLFIGGDTEWKLGEAAASLVAEAKARDKWVHMGRVNTKKRMQYAYNIGCDSIDGTTIAYEPMRYMPAINRWLKEMHGTN